MGCPLVSQPANEYHRLGVLLSRFGLRFPHALPDLARGSNFDPKDLGMAANSLSRFV